MDWKNNYCKNAYTTQSYLQIQCNSIKYPMIVSQNRKKS